MDLATRKMVYYGLLGLLIAGSTIAVFRVAPQVVPVQFLAKYGTLSTYLENVQPDISGNPIITSPLTSGLPNISGRLLGDLLSLNVTIDSVTIHQSGVSNGDGITTSNTKFTFDVLRPFSVSKLISTAEIPAENVTMVDLHVASATAAVLGLGIQPVNVPSKELKIPVSPAVQIRGQLNSSIVISGTAHIVFNGTGGITLTPILHVERTTEPQ
jgi:hypothetical protein